MSVSVHTPEATFQVASIEMPCGAAILANVFAAWNFPVINPWNLDTSTLYRIDEAGIVTCSKPSGFEAFMPVIEERQHFEWRHDAVPYFHHRKPERSPALERVLWVIRDPRDCLYSDWRRQQDQFETFEGYLNSDWKNSGLTPAAYLELFHASWISAESDFDVLRVRFEDLKQDPLSTFMAIVRHLHIELNQEDLQNLEKYVDIETARTASESLPAELKPNFSMVRAGKVQEWRTQWARSHFACLPASWRSLMENLDYPRNPT